ncbi:trypsin-like peptidase domain-containing protein [Streptomyces silvisoli]|uniref:Trypsin-like peptidase domain-containing protein n=1 Tax=Streptomyces silvisoli TaxID=3034235 RepID=A0ABT5ZQ64_9ACTN|nr:trypsin-like peptidase domain-containing protein [Streptomyces silvisoli]MDF3291962.1 trypsin-like peptidase domain-containing protein [Streptomyces silvisoli]
MDEGKAARPHWWSRPQEAPRSQDPTAPSDPEAPAGVPQMAEPAPAQPAPADGADAGPDSGDRPDGTPPTPADAAQRPSLSKEPAPEPSQAAEPSDRPAIPPAPAVPPSQPVPANPYAAPVAGAGHPADAAAPRHPADPYGTPPYGRPGPWAPAPPVQRPTAPPAYPAAPPAAPPPGDWHRYDPWAPPAQPTPTPKRRGLVVAVAAAAIIAGLIGGVAGAYVQRQEAGPGITLPQAPADHGGRAPGTVAGIAARTLPGVVYIHVKGNGEEGTGTGFVLDTQGHILTNNHVVAPASSSGDISVTFSGGATHKATIVGRDTGDDLAVIKVGGVSGLKPLPLGNSESVRVGDPVVAIGAPYDLEGTVTSGIISAKDRPITASGGAGGAGEVSYVNALQTDAPINPGNSGGPLMNAQAQVIGINSAIRAADNGSPDGAGSQGGSIGLGFAIPINQAKRVAEELINTGKAVHPVIGVTVDMRYVGDGARIADQGPNGAPAVTPGGPGANAGLKPGDIITQVDGEPVHTGAELIVRTRSHTPGDHIKLMVRSGDAAPRPVDLVLGGSTTG